MIIRFPFWAGALVWLVAVSAALLSVALIPLVGDPAGEARRLLLDGATGN